MDHAKDTYIAIAKPTRNDEPILRSLGKTYVYFSKFHQTISGSHVKLIALFLILSLTPLVHSQEDKKGMSMTNRADYSRRPAGIKELIKSGMPYVMIAPEEREDAKKRIESLEDTINYDGDSKDYPQYHGDLYNNKGNGHLMEKRYRYVGKRLRDRYRMAFGLGKRQDMRYAFGTDSNSQNRQLLPYYYYLGPLRTQLRSSANLYTHDSNGVQGDAVNRFKRPVDRYRTFFGLGR